MTFTDIYVNLIRILLLALTMYKVIKNDFKLVIPAIIVFVLTFLISMLEKVLEIKIDAVGSFLYYTVIFMSIYLGGGFKFYNKIACWDRIIHCLSGATSVSLGVALSTNAADLSRFSILFFSLTLASFFHVLWEIAEYIIDSITHSDHQRWQKYHKKTVNHKPNSAIQSAGLVDTMNDTIVCIIGALTACVVWWFIL